MTTTMSKCAGFVYYARHPDRPPRWHRCDEPRGITDRCFACELDHLAARRHEAADEVARAKVRAALWTAIAQLADEYQAIINGILRMCAVELEAAVKATGELGGSGNYWLAWRLLLGLDEPPHDPVD